MRKLDVVLALLASLAGFGYPYVGRMRLGFVAIGALTVGIATLSWSRWILRPWGIYVLLALCAAFGLVMLILPVVLAWQSPTQPRKSYNRWWAYVLWALGTAGLGEVFRFTRAPLFGYDIYTVPSVSMAPTLEVGDFFEVDT